MKMYKNLWKWKFRFCCRTWWTLSCPLENICLLYCSILEEHADLELHIRRLQDWRSSYPRVFEGQGVLTLREQRGEDGTVVVGLKVVLLSQTWEIYADLSSRIEIFFQSIRWKCLFLMYYHWGSHKKNTLWVDKSKTPGIYSKSKRATPHHSTENDK